MGLWELFIIAVGLSMDAFAVSICKGLSVDKIQPKHELLVGLYFGGFQALMPALGYFFGVHFQSFIINIDHWIAFGLLAVIGGNMIYEAQKGGECTDDSFALKSMLPLAVATSIDALAVGVTFAFLQVEILPAVSFIGSVTFFLSALGLWVGNVFGAKYKIKAEIFGGVILIAMGTKILLEHLGMF